MPGVAVVEDGCLGFGADVGGSGIGVFAEDAALGFFEGDFACGFFPPQPEAANKTNTEHKIRAAALQSSFMNSSSIETGKHPVSTWHTGVPPTVVPG